MYPSVTDKEYIVRFTRACKALDVLSQGKASVGGPQEQAPGLPDALLVLGLHQRTDCLKKTKQNKTETQVLSRHSDTGW